LRGCGVEILYRLALILVLILPISVAMADVTGKPRVIDGDTIHMGKTKVRLHGIDAPETKQECYRVNGSPYRCEEKPPQTHCTFS